MASYAGKTKLPRGDFSDILEGGNYMGPTRYAPAAGGISIGGGLGLLFNKLFNKKKEDEDDEEKKSQADIHREEWEKKKKTLPKQDPEGDWVVLDPHGREDSRWRTAEEAEAERQFWENDPDDLLGYSVKNVKEQADYSFDLPEHTQKILDELRKKYGDKETDALEKKIRLGIKSETKHAQGGLVGINHLTRRL